MTWYPGQRVITEQDRLEWERWRKERKLQQQRARRASCKRIDYYPSDAAAKVISSRIQPRSGGDYSTVINYIVEEWLAARRTS